MEPIRRRRIASPQLELPNVAAGEPIDSTQAEAASSVENVDDGWDVPPTQQAAQDSVAPESTQPQSTATASSAETPAVAAAASSTSTNDAPEDIRATTQSARDPSAQQVPSAKDPGVKAPSAKDPSGGGTAPRRHDMRAPRVRRSTRESELFRQPAAPAEPKRNVAAPTSESGEPRVETQERRPDLRERRPDLRERRPDLREPRRPERRDSADLLGPRRPERRDSSDLLGPRRPDRAARNVVEDGEPARPVVAAPPAASVKPKPKVVPAPVAKVEAAPPPAAPSLAEELRVFGAKPVAERQTAQKADKPRTAKDAMRERARANQEARNVKAPKTLRSGEIEKREANASKPATSTTEQTKAAGALPVGSSKAAAKEESSAELSTVKPSKHAKAKAKALRKREAKPEVETEEEEIVVVKPGFWARVKSFFTG